MSLTTEPSQPDARAARHLPPKSYAEAAEEALDASHESQTDGADNAQDCAPKVLNIKMPAATDKEQYEGQGQQVESPKSPSRPHRRKPSKHSQQSNGSVSHQPVENGHGNGKLEKHVDGNGEALTSVQPSPDYPSSTKPARRRDSELKRGREAGAGWRTSKCVAPFFPVYLNSVIIEPLVLTMCCAQDSLGTLQCTPPTPPTNPRRAHAHAQHRRHRSHLLFPLCHPPTVAPAASVHNLRPSLHCRYFR